VGKREGGNMFKQEMKEGVQVKEGREEKVFKRKEKQSKSYGRCIVFYLSLATSGIPDEVGSQQPAWHRGEVDQGSVLKREGRS
jgi:hypothetical protein